MRLDRFDDVRIVRKLDSAHGMPKATSVHSTTVNSIADKLDRSSKGKYNETNFEARLQAVMTPMVNEGFFADVAVLVEGEGDRAALLEAAQAMGCSLDAQGDRCHPMRRQRQSHSPSSHPPRTQHPHLCDLGRRQEPEKQRHARHITTACFKSSKWRKRTGQDTSALHLPASRTSSKTRLKVEIGERAYEQSMNDAVRHYALTGNNRRKNALVMQRVVRRGIRERQRQRGTHVNRGAHHTDARQQPGHRGDQAVSTALTSGLKTACPTASASRDLMISFWMHAATSAAVGSQRRQTATATHRSERQNESE